MIKTKTAQPTTLAFIALLSAIIFHPPYLRAQGALTPPGAPGPTMKSLDQLEPRTIVNAVNTPGDSGDTFIISQPGSYYLTTNLTVTSGQSGITIATNNVTLDLGGFLLLTTEPGKVGGIQVAGSLTNLTVCHGRIIGWGFGVQAFAATSENLVFDRLDISGCTDGMGLGGGGVIRNCNVTGCSGAGIASGYSASQGYFISGCFVENNAAIGIELRNGSASGCTANQNGNGISSVNGNVSGCTANGNEAEGIYVSQGTVTGCTADGNGSYGFIVLSGTVSGDTAENNDDSGILGYLTVISGCAADNNGNKGIELDYYGSTATGGSVVDCVVQGNANDGIFVNGTGSLIAGNTCDNNNTSTNSGCAGITLYGSGSVNNRVENNHIAGTGYAGLNVGGTNNLIIKNSVFGNGAKDYLITGTQITGPIITATGAISSTSPWANFAF